MYNRKSYGSRPYSAFTNVTVTVSAPPFAQFDWPLSQPAQPQVDLRTWTQFYNINLIGKDAFPVGRISAELAPGQLPYRPFDLTWAASYNKNLIGQDQLPVGAVRTDLTAAQVPPRPLNLQSWLSWYNVNLVGQDQLPAGSVRTDLTSGQVPPRAIDLNWLWSYNVNLIGKDKLPTGKVRTELTEAQKPARQVDLSWTAFYNRNLIGKDVLPTGNRHFDTPAQLPYYDRASFSASYNRNLIGKDQFPVRVTDWPLPRQPADGRSWIQSVNLALTTAPVVFPFRQFDWPLGFAPRQPVQTFVASYNQNLIGKDRLPVRVLDWALPARPSTVNTWISSVNLALLQQQPVVQRDWPLSAGAPQPDRSFVSSFNRNLIGADQLPVRVSDWTPPTQRPVANTWIQSVNLALLQQQQQRPFTQSDWPLFAGAWRWDRSFASSFNLNLIGVAPLPAEPSGPWHTYSRIPLRAGRRRKLERQLEEIAELEALAATLRAMRPAVLVEAKPQVIQLELDANNLASDLFRQITVADRAKQDELAQQAQTQRERVMRIMAFAQAERARIMDEEEAILLLLACDFGGTADIGATRWPSDKGKT